MSIKNNKNATEFLSLILSLMDDDDRAELRTAMDEGEESKDEPTLCDECSDRDICPDSSFCLNDDEEDENDDADDEWDDKDEDDDDVSTIEITIPYGVPCIVMGGTDDELPLAIELIKEMGLVSPAPAPNKSRVRGEIVNRNQNVPEGSISGRTLREMIDRIVEAAKEPAEGSAAWLDKYHY